MDPLRAMKVFIRVIDEGGFAKAARALDMAPAVVTRVIAELEARLGARLLNRTTRRIALTEVGVAYLERARQIVVDVEEAEALASEATKEPRGTVRVLTTPALSVHQIAKHLPEFRRRYPQVSVEISAPGAVEAIDEDFDLTLLVVRQPPDGDFVARRLARSEVILCATPEYLGRRGRPQHPRDLLHHDALIPPISALQRGLTFYAGHFGDDEPAGETYTLVPSASAALRTTHVDTNYAAALQGLGIAGLPSLVVEDALVEHALERVLPGWRLFDLQIWAAVPSRKHLPARTRALLDFLVEVFGGEDRDPWLAAAGCETAFGQVAGVV
jgi:DNA-binding transcriptional LysR family regulator